MGSARDRARNSRNHFRLLADGRFNGNLKIREFPVYRCDESWQVILQMRARSEEHRHHAQAAHAFAMERGGAFGQRRPHQFEEGKHDALAGQQLAQLGYELLERARPLRLARTVGEKDNCSPDECLFGHVSIIREAAASR